jgi:Xaa-Pro aminopeptidase
VEPEKAVLVTDNRYVLQASAECPGWTVIKTVGYGPKPVKALFLENGWTEIAFDPAAVSVLQHGDLLEEFGSDITLKPAAKLVENLRQVKDEDEIELIRKACEVTDRAFSHILPFVKPGVSERDLALELEWYIRKTEGAENAFGMIVASGARSALPHGVASGKLVETGDFITFDFGAKWQGYNADMTRTVVVGQPTEEQRRVYNTVQGALELGVSLAVPGAVGKDVDEKVRSWTEQQGYPEHRFEHGLGHGLGIQVHDGPGIGRGSELILSPGNVLTVEPGIYVPGWGGVRIEHDIVVRSGGAEILNSSTTELLIL